MGFPINPPNTPMVNENGLLTTPWYRFFSQIQKMLGSGVTSPFDDSSILGGVTLLGEQSGGSIVPNAVAPSAEARASLEWAPEVAIHPGTLKVGSGLTGGGNMAGNVAIGLSVATTSGAYTPTLTGIANITSTAAYACQYLRVGSVVTVSGKFDVQPAASPALTQFRMTLPIASNFSAPENVGGTAFSINLAGSGAAIRADAASDLAEVTFICVDANNHAWHFSFTYQVI